MLQKVLKKIQFKIDDLVEYTAHDAIFLGNDLEDSFYNHFEFQHFHQNFFNQDYIDSGILPDTFIIVGGVNLNQVQVAKQIYEKYEKSLTCVIHLNGKEQSFINGKNYFLVDNLKDYFPVDIEYKRFPYDLSEINKKIIQLKRAKNGT